MHPKRLQFVSLYNAEADAIFRFCFLRTSDREVALDITQETFMRFWDALVEKRSIDNHRAFLFTIARHRVVDWYRKKKSHSLEALMEEHEHGEIDSFLPHEDGAKERIEMDAEGRFLIQKIRELEPLYQQIVYLRFVEGLTPKDIANIVGETVNTVAVRLHRGMEKLRELTGYSEETKI